MSDRVEINKGSGNVFVDVGLSPETLFKAELARQISHIIAERNLTQSDAANILGIDQPKVSALKRGKLKGFSIDRLFQYLTALGQDVKVHIEKNESAEQAGRLTLVH